MVRYVKTEKTPKRDWRNPQAIAALEALGTLEALDGAAELRWHAQAIYRMGGYGRWIAKKDSETSQAPTQGASGGPCGG